MLRKKHAIAPLCGAILLCGAAQATVPVSAEVSYSIDSKYLCYGLVDNNEPIQTVSAYLTFFDWLSVGAETLFDMTTYGRRAGYTSREFQCNEFNPNVSLEHVFSPDDIEWLPTTVAFEFCYTYEYMPRAKGRWYEELSEDSQFWSMELSLPDLWMEPAFCYERDTDRDNGTYLNLSFGHSFALIDGESEGAKPVLSLRPSVAQGFGNSQRVGGYLCHDDDDFTPLDHAGLMDTLLKLTLTWKASDWLEVSAYAGYSDFLFDRQIRDAARRYELTGDWNHSWNFIGGCAITASF